MTLDRRCERIIDSLRSAATEVLDEVPKEVRKVPWNDDPELQKLLKKREITSRKSQGYKSLSKSIKKRIKDLRNQFYSSEADAISQFAIQRDIEKMFRRANEQESTLKKAPSKGCATSKLRDHFKSHFNPTYDNDTQPPELFENSPLFVENLLEITSAIQVDASVPTIDELRKIILSLKNGKVASDLPPEPLKYAAYSDEFLNKVYVVMAEI